MADIHGVCEERFEAVRSALARNLDSGEELGASLVLDIDGDVVIDIWGGFRDQARTVPWDEHTITNVWSSTKTVTSLAALMLADRGELDVDRRSPSTGRSSRPTASRTSWSAICMSHASGVSGLDQPAVVADLYDWEQVHLPDGGPGSVVGTGYRVGLPRAQFGHLVGEVVRRISGKTLKQFVAEEIAGPLGADFQIGAAESDWGRIANVVPPPPLPFDLAALGTGQPRGQDVHRSGP